MGLRRYLETARCSQVSLQSSRRCRGQQPAQAPVQQAGRPGLFVPHCAHMPDSPWDPRELQVMSSSCGEPASLHSTSPSLDPSSVLPPRACGLTGLQEGFCGLECPLSSSWDHCKLCSCVPLKDAWRGCLKVPGAVASCILCSHYLVISEEKSGPLLWMEYVFRYRGSRPASPR